MAIVRIRNKAGRIESRFVSSLENWEVLADGTRREIRANDGRLRGDGQLAHSHDHTHMRSDDGDDVSDDIQDLLDTIDDLQDQVDDQADDRGLTPRGRLSSIRRGLHVVAIRRDGQNFVHDHAHGHDSPFDHSPHDHAEDHASLGIDVRGIN